MMKKTIPKKVPGDSMKIMLNPFQANVPFIYLLKTGGGGGGGGGGRTEMEYGRKWVKVSHKSLPKNYLSNTLNLRLIFVTEKLSGGFIKSVSSENIPLNQTVFRYTRFFL